MCEGSRVTSSMRQQRCSSHAVPKWLADQIKLEPVVTKTNVGTLSSFLQSLQKVGRIPSFPFHGAGGSSQFPLNHIGHGSPCLHVGYTSLWSLTAMLSLCFLGLSVTKERPFCLLKIARRVSQLLEEEVELNWLRVESPESDLGLASLGSRAHFLFTSELIMVSKLVCQDASRAG